MNVQKALLPGLWSMLVAGGNGSARVIYPCLLPLLSKLSEKVSENLLEEFCIRLILIFPDPNLL